MRNKCPKCGSGNLDLLTVFRNDLRDKYHCSDCGCDFVYPPFTYFDRITQSPEVLAKELVTLDCDSLWFAWAGIGRREAFSTREEAIAATVARLKEVEK